MCKDRNKLLEEFVSKGGNFEAMQNSIVLEKTTEFEGKALRKRKDPQELPPGFVGTPDLGNSLFPKSPVPTNPGGSS